MISIKDRIHKNRLKKNLRKLREAYEADIKKAEKEGKKRVDIQAIFAEMDGCCRNDEFEIEKILTRELTNKARKYYIELPDRNDEIFWENGFGYYILSDHGKSTLSKQIKAHRREDYEFIFKIISVLIGLIGALIGLVAVINK